MRDVFSAHARHPSFKSGVKLLNYCLVIMCLGYYWYVIISSLKILE